MAATRPQLRVCRNCGHTRRNHPAEGKCTASGCECARMVYVGVVELWAWVQNNDDADTMPVKGTVVCVRFDATSPPQLLPLLHETREVALSPVMKALAVSHAEQFGVDVRLVHLREVGE